jgi:hypothetical protein
MSCRLTEKNVTFIHIPKTGGKSIRKFLETNHDFVRKTIHGKDNLEKLSPAEWNKAKHPTMIETKEIYGLDDLGYIFTCVRNPYHRIMSGYFHMTHMKIIPNCTFSRFIKDKIHYDGFMRPMVDYIEDMTGVNHIMKYETLTEDFEYIKSELKLEGDLPNIGKSFNTNNVYSNIYKNNPEFIKMVYNLYRPDFIRFEYDRDQI